MKEKSLFNRSRFYIIAIALWITTGSNFCWAGDLLSATKTAIDRRFAEAARFLERNSVLKEDFRTFYNFGVALAASGKYEEAEEAFRKAAELEPNDPSAHYQLALAFLGQSKKTEAKKEFHAYLRLKPDAADRKEVEEILRSL